jgi:uncharacterized protein with HEPN domain
MDEQDRRHLAYIRTSIALIESRTRQGREAFWRDVDRQDAVLWRLQTRAGATGKLSPAIRDRHPAIRWRAIYGFRNIAAHAYLALQLEQVWEIIDEHLPTLTAAIDDELAR